MNTRSPGDNTDGKPRSPSNPGDTDTDSNENSFHGRDGRESNDGTDGETSSEGSADDLPPGENQHDDLQIDNLPNRLTFLRVLLVPIVIWGLMDGLPWKNQIAFVVFVVAAITDYFDGYYARARKIITIMGQLLDPLADKLLILSSLAMLQHLGRIHPIVVIVLLSREFAITGLRAVASAEGIVIPASGLAKWKTVAQMIGIPALMLGTGIEFMNRWFPPMIVGNIFIYLSLFISVWSAKDYVVDFFRAMAKHRRQKREARLLAKQKKMRRRSST